MGDYDGDQTTVKVVFTQEANEECDRVMNEKSYFINASGQIIRKVENEAIQTLYVMTKEPPANANELTTLSTVSFLEKTPSDFTFEYLVENFGTVTTNAGGNRSTKIIPSKFNMTDIVDIRTPYLGFTGKTTLGRLIYNKIIIEGCGLEEIVGYVNEPITDGKNKFIEKLIANGLKEDQVSVDNMYKYVDTRDWLTLQLHSVICTSFTLKTLTKPKEVDDLHKELLKKYKKELDNNDEKISETIEKALIAKTKEVLKDDVGMDLYVSGARGSIDNNFKNIYLTRGAVKNLQTGGYDVIKGSLMDGLDKKDIAAHSNNILMGAYPKAVGTQVSGYLAKELSSAMQTEVLGDNGSDCGTIKGLTVTIPKNKTDDYLYRYIIENDKLVCLTPDIIGKYIGKTVKMRSPMYCIAKDCICSKCAGEDFYKLGKKAIGLTATKVATTCSRMNMKKFHENLVKTRDIDINDIFL